MRCILVLDIFNGAVVHAFRGERSSYELIHLHSRIVSSSDPLSIVESIKPKEVYIADLNLLTGSGQNIGAIKEISWQAKTMADIGISQTTHLRCLPDEITPVLGTETASLKIIEQASTLRDVVVSLDMKARKLLTRDPEMPLDPIANLRSLNSFSLQSIIILELDRVGTLSGLDKEFLEKVTSASDHPLILGGGVRDIEDIWSLEDLGFRGVLLATAIHSGKIPLKMLR